MHSIGEEKSRLFYAQKATEEKVISNR